MRAPWIKDGDIPHTPYEIMKGDEVMNNLTAEIDVVRRVSTRPELPELKLVRAVLVETILTLHRCQRANMKRRAVRRLYQEAIDWLFSAKEHPFSFIWVCELLDLSPSAARREIIALTKNRQVTVGTSQHSPSLGIHHPSLRHRQCGSVAVPPDSPQDNTIAQTS